MLKIHNTQKRDRKPWHRKNESQGRACTCRAGGESYLLAALALVRLFSAVDAFVPLQVVPLDEAHVTHVARERLLTWRAQKQRSITTHGAFTTSQLQHTLYV